VNAVLSTAARHALPSAPARDVPSWRERSRTRIASWLDDLALRAMSLAFDATLMPDADEERDFRTSAEPYLAEQLVQQPDGFFAFLNDVRREPSPVSMGPRRRIRDGSVVEASLASAYRPFHCPADDPACSENEIVPLVHWKHEAPAPATLLMLHGFTMGNFRVDAAVLMVEEWYGRGLDVVQMALPFHGARCPAEARFSGERFASWHVGRLNEAVRQSVNDVVRVIAWLRAEQPETPVGIVGVSLGGYVAALLAELDEALAFVLPVAAPVHLGLLPSTLFARSRYGTVMAPPLAPEELERAYRAHCPLTHALAVPRERVFLVAGRGDRVVPPAHVVALWDHWGRPALHWYGGSHVVPFRRREILGAGVAHLRRIGVLAGA
jgi:predicted alpha/beta-fold hydrolase